MQIINFVVADACARVKTWLLDLPASIIPCSRKAKVAASKWFGFAEMIQKLSQFRPASKFATNVMYVAPDQTGLEG